FEIKSDKKLSMITIEKQMAEGNEFDFVDVKLNGYENSVKVLLNTNGRQAISLLEYWDKGSDKLFDASDYYLN
ncbi:hypothetical protein D6U74_19110, partial [Vibrio cholerae]|nr:hypothetical protein [Vibrio cholerae]